MSSSTAYPSESDLAAAAELCRLLQETPNEVNDILNFAFENRRAAKTRYRGSYPLSVAIEQRASYDIIVILCRQHPAALLYPINYRKVTPFHLAMIKKLPLDVLEFLVDEMPDIARAVTKYGSTPLHYLCDRNPPRDKLSLLLNRYPQAASMQDTLGRTPLHCLFENKVPLEAVKPLLNVNPHAINVQDTKGQTPVHHACDVRVCFAVFAEMVKISPSVAMIQDNNGKTPLHLACDDVVLSECVPLFLEASPTIARVKDSKGLCPLHLACRSGQSSAVKMLLEASPSVVRLESNEGYSPLFLASSRLDGEASMILWNVFRLFEERMDNFTAAAIMEYFNHIQWWFGVRLVIDVFPQVKEYLEDLPLTTVPSALSMIGQHCRYLAVWDMVRNRPDLFQ